VVAIFLRYLTINLFHTVFKLNLVPNVSPTQFFFKTLAASLDKSDVTTTSAPPW